MSITMRRKKSEKITYLFVIPIIGHPPKDKNVGEKSSDGGMNRWGQRICLLGSQMASLLLVMPSHGLPSVCLGPYLLPHMDNSHPGLAPAQRTYFYLHHLFLSSLSNTASS